MAKKPEHKKQKQYCNKFNKDFKNGPHQKNLKKKGRFQINNPNSYLNKLEKGKQTKPKASRRKEIISIGAEINEIENGNKWRKSVRLYVGSLRR